ncbi:MAG: DUF262 domain-containing protein [Candidatus Moraniibacteriota bacterium]|nr:MAG: DUF262 domain-containing protein [Candidatus Moranbacteria bacterium]
MKIELNRIPVREVVTGYKDSAEEGVVAYEGKLDVRPKYQREFVYKDKQRNAVIDTVRKGFPLNVMYWVKTDEGNFEVLDGQQRTISLGQYVNGDFSVDFNGRLAMFHNLTKEEQEQILNYELMIYFCEGTDKEKLDWFKIINIAGEKLTDQELRNAVYTGSWLSDAKLKFSKSNCAAYLLANDGGSLVNGSPIRQEYLETALLWISNGEIEDYMAKHQHDENAEELWQYFQNVIAWAHKIFTKYRKEMKGVEWGRLYNRYKDTAYDSREIEEKTLELINDDEVQSLKGIYEYILTGEDKHLNLRQFEDKTRRKAYEKQKGKCVWCKKTFEFEEMEADHITPWHEGGKTTAENCQMLCKQDNRTKSGK